MTDGHRKKNERGCPGTLDAVLNGTELRWVEEEVGTLNTNSSSMHLFSSRKIAY